ncbi:MAG: PcfB family protein [Lachnospiraceae bacterium]|nr:PcfB family protein [Lachnospiraceae bacterium]
MQEEVENRTVNLVISSTKLTARAIITGYQKFNAWQKNKKAVKTAQKNAALKEKANAKPTGKQTVQELIGQNQGVQSIDIAATDIKGFEKYANKYGVDYAVKKDISENPPRYLVFFKARDNDALTAAFKEYSASVLNTKQRKPSVLKELQKYKELAAKLPGKVREKIQEIGR